MPHFGIDYVSKKMNKPIRVMGIESSCDETSVSIVEKRDNKINVLSNIVKSQIDIHKYYGGVVPELAARAHSDIIDKLIKLAIDQSGLNLKKIDAIAATAGPGLLGGLLVGVVAGKTLAHYSNKPFIAINHLEGHALSIKLERDIN